MWDGTWGTLETSGEQTFREPRFPALGGQGLGTEQEVVLPLQLGVIETQGVRATLHYTYFTAYRDTT